MKFRVTKKEDTKTDVRNLSGKVFIIIVVLLLFYASTLSSFKAVNLLKNNLSFKTDLIYFKVLKVPDVSLVSLDTKKTYTSLYKNLQQPVNVFFLVSSSCPYCIREVSDFASNEKVVLQQFSNTRFIFCFLDDKTSVESFLEKTKLNLPNVYILDDRSFLRNLGIKYVPATLIINKNKYLVWRKSGFFELKDLLKLLKTYKERR